MEKILEFNEAKFFIRDNTENAYGVAGVMSLGHEIEDGHYILDLEDAKYGIVSLIKSDELDTMINNQGMEDSYKEECLSSIARMKFFRLDTEMKMAHVYARQVHTDEHMNSSMVAFFGCIRPDSVFDLPKETVISVFDNKMEETAKVPVGNHVIHVLKEDVFAINDKKMYSGNNLSVDKKRRDFHIELAKLGSGSSMEDRIALREKYYPKNESERFLDSRHVDDNEFIDFLTSKYCEGLDSDKAVRKVLKRSQSLDVGY